MTETVKFQVKTFEQLTKEQLYEILRLRAEVFVVEQDCPYQDVDGKDQKALHVLGYHDDKLMAYTRIFKAGDYFKNASIGRVVVKKSFRESAYGKQLMQVSIEAVQSHFLVEIIEISAQKYLTRFYTVLGFVPTGEEYLEDGIPHLRMIKHKKT